MRLALWWIRDRFKDYACLSLLPLASFGCSAHEATEAGHTESTQQALGITCGESHGNPGDVEPQLHTLSLPRGLFFDRLLLGAAEFLRTANGVDVSAGPLVSMGDSGALVGNNARIGAVYSRGPLLVGDNVVRSGLILSENSVALGNNVSSTNITTFGSFQPEQIYEYSSIPPRGGPNGNVLAGTTVLSPGAYGFYAVGEGALQLSSGVYTFSQLSLNPGSELLLDQEAGPIVLHIGTPGTWHGAVQVLDGGDPDLLMVYMGEDWLRFSAPANLHVVAPNGHLALEHVGPHSGTFYGMEVLVSSGAVVHQRPAQLGRFFPPTIPARVEAEDYIKRQDTSHDNNQGKAGSPSCDRGDGVDMELTSDPKGGECNIGWTRSGEWLEYDVLVETGRSFTVTARVASASSGKSLTISVDGTNVGTLTAPNQGWQSWQDRTTAPVLLSPGRHTVRVAFNTDEVNLNYLELKELGDTILAATFDTDADGFTFVPDTFRGTQRPEYSDGEVNGAALHVTLGGSSTQVNNLSGGWRTSFVLPEETAVDLNFYYSLWMSSGYEADECGEVLVAVDGVLFGTSPHDYVARRCDDGNLSGNFHQTIVLPAGPHELTIGGYNNKSTFADEVTTIHIDNVFLFEGSE
jgi:hypothetical protein